MTPLPRKNAALSTKHLRSGCVHVIRVGGRVLAGRGWLGICNYVELIDKIVTDVEGVD